MINYQQKFQKQLAQGQMFERMALRYFPHETYEMTPKGCKTHDFTIRHKGNDVRVEVKSEILAFHTNNVAIEYECSGKPSGIRSTLADWWVHFIVDEENGNHEVFKIPVENLKKMVGSGHYRSVSGGDRYRSKMYIIPKWCLSKWATPLLE
jgi:hypothetical protein